MRMKKTRKKKRKRSHFFLTRKAILKYFVLLIMWRKWKQSFQSITFCHCLSLCRLPPSLLLLSFRPFYSRHPCKDIYIYISNDDSNTNGLKIVIIISCDTPQSFSFCQLFPPSFVKEKKKKMNKVDYLFF